ncbi:MAG: peptide chain release factor N(5)-glutamine methyltransferase [Halanaerobiales bacterium]
MNIKELLVRAEEYLQRFDVPSPRLDAEVLLADLLDMERINLYVKFDYPLTDEELSAYRRRLKKRARRYPVSYITGKKEFMSLELEMEEGVLIPRPETELLVEEIINFCEENQLQSPNIVDVGTGSGAIMVSLGYYLDEARVLGVDISEKAVKLARCNINKYNLENRLQASRTDLLEPLLKRDMEIDIIAANLPYIKNEDLTELSPEVKKEPEKALAGGQDGLKYYRRLLPQAEKLLRSGGLIGMEIDPHQVDKMCSILEKQDWKQIEIKEDHGGYERIVLAVKGQEYAL